MRKRRRLIIIAGILLISEITIKLIVIHRLGGSLHVTDGIRFFLMTFLAMNLVLGKEWARIILALLCLLGAGASAIVPFLLIFNNVTPAENPFFFVSVLMCIVYLSTCIYLFVSPGVSREIRRANH